jgi:hypothetical protein
LNIGILEEWNAGIMLKAPKKTAKHESTKFAKHEKRDLSQRRRAPLE